MVLYVAGSHVNKAATGAWVYPVIDDVTAAGGPVARSAFFVVLSGITMALGWVGVKLVNGNNNRRKESQKEILRAHLKGRKPDRGGARERHPPCFGLANF
eukprot:FR735739.1.p4 GENE.FR735739.1~~FR735739.1.p4  ORF type:complete len:100 (+),score=19.67 FR735739.1:705-1004(+)